MKLTAAILLGASLVAQVQSQWAIGTGTRPLSPSVAGTLITRNGMLELVILWRGAPGWLLAAERGSGGGSGDAIGGVIEYGAIRLEYSYAAASHVARIQGIPVPLAGGRNVIMVDNVDGPGGAVVSGTARLDGRYDSPQTPLAPLIGTAPDVAQFSPL